MNTILECEMFRIKEVPHPTAEVEILIAELDEYLCSLYPNESNHLAPVSELFTDATVFLVATMGDQLIGCGSVIVASEGYAEVKRLYVRNAFRQLKVAKAIMFEIERHMLAVGVSRLCLETGVKQEAAVNLYKRLGYFEREPFGSYIADPLSCFFEKQLVTSKSHPHT